MVTNLGGADSQPPRWRLPPSHQELLRTALGGRESERIVTSEQRAVIRGICRGICSAPERQSFEPEDFLIAFKLALVDAANDAGIPPGPDRNDFLARLVSVYIEEFYRLPVTAGDAAEKARGQDLGAGSTLPALTNSDVAHTLPDARPSA